MILITFRLRGIVERGLTSGLHRTWLAERPRCPKSHGSAPVPVGIEEFSPALFFMLIGSALATFVMIVEHCYVQRSV